MTKKLTLEELDKEVMEAIEAPLLQNGNGRGSDALQSLIKRAQARNRQVLNQQITGPTRRPQ